MTKRETIFVWIVVIVFLVAVVIDFKTRRKQEPYKGKYVGATADIMRKLDKLDADGSIVTSK